LETEQYYLDFAEASPFSKDLSSAYEALKEFHEYEEDKRIVVVVDDVFNMGSDPDLNILDAFYLGKGSSECFPIACIIDREEMKFAEIQRGKEIILTLCASPTSELTVFGNEEDYNRENPHGFAVRSFCPSWQLTYVDGDEVPDPSACFTGFVKKVHDLFKNENEEFHYYAADVDTLGILITVMLRDDREPIPKPGNVVSGVYRLNGYIDTEDQDDDYVKKLSDRSREMKSKQGDDELNQEVRRYWISDWGDGYNSALKVIATPLGIKLIHYNRSCKEGKEVEGENFYKIAIGMNFDYETTDEKGFLEFIQNI
jgi:hypothetical protein